MQEMVVIFKQSNLNPLTACLPELMQQKRKKKDVDILTRGVYDGDDDG